MLDSETSLMTGESIYTVSIDKPGYYRCQVTQDGGISRNFTVGLFDLLYFTGKCIHSELI